MANNRYLNTNFWKDTYVIDLDPIQKLLFIYLLTNPRTNIAGIYEIAVREIAFDTGIDKDMVLKILDKFITDEKIIYKKGWLVMQNWLKHQSLNPKVSSGIQRILENDVPKWLIDEIITTNNRGQLDLLAEPIDSLSKPITLNIIKFNSNIIKSNADSGEDSKKINKKQYAMAVKADKEQSERVNQTTADRLGKGYNSFAKAGDILRNKHKK